MDEPVELLGEVLALTAECHPQSLRQLRWHAARRLRRAVQGGDGPGSRGQHRPRQSVTRGTGAVHEVSAASNRRRQPMCGQRSEMACNALSWSR